MSSLVKDSLVANTSLKLVDGQTTKPKRSRSTAKQVQPSSPKKSRSKSTSKSILAKPSFEKVAIMATTLALLLVSLFDLAKGIQLLTQCETWQSVAIAVGIDAMFVAVEYSVLRQGRDHMSDALTSMTLAMSAYLNALAMSHGNLDYSHSNAITLGVFIPAAIFLATHRLGKIK